jgi:hypothetical protein
VYEFNDSIKTLQENDIVATKLGTGFRNILQSMVTSIQNGDYSQFQNIIKVFETNLPSMSGTQSQTNLE